MSSELGAWRQISDLAFMFIRHVQLAVLASTLRGRKKMENSNTCLCTPNSNELDFFRKLFYSNPQVCSWEAPGKV